VPPRILPGHWRLDKLPAFIAVPIGAVVGGLVGYRVATPGQVATGIALVVLIAIAVLWCALSAPRPLPNTPKPRSKPL